MNVPSAAAAVLLVVGCSLGTSAEAQSVTVAVRALGESYQLESFGRRLDLRLELLTGIPTLEECSPVDPENVVLVLTLPSGVDFVAESFGGAVYDPVAGTVTWNFGTLDRFTHCFGTRIDTTVDADDAIAGGTMLTATAVISTTTPGDDSADNMASETFQVGLLPLEVFVDSNSFCDAGSDDADSDTGEFLSCADSDPGILPAEASASVGGMNPSGKLGELTASGGTLAAPKASVRAWSYGGFDCNPTLDFCLPLSVSAEATVTQGVEIVNPNPFDVPLRLWRDTYAHAGCSDNDALFPGDAFVEDSIPSVECGSSFDNDFPYGVAHLFCDGVTNLCIREGVVTTDELEDITVEFSNSIARVPRFGRREISNDFGSGDADGDSNVFDFGTGLIIIRSGYGYYNAASRVTVGLASASTATTGNVDEIVFRAESPVDLLVTDENGDRVGADPNTTAPDPGAGVSVLLGTRTLAEIPGSRYSGPASEPEEIVIGLPDTGTYLLEVRGTGDGPFRITAESRGADGTVVSEHAFTGTATAGSFLSREFALDADGSLMPVVATPVPCDVDADGDVDQADIGAILSARNQSASGDDDPRDPDGDGLITVLDARFCVLQCTLPRCATP